MFTSERIDILEKEIKELKERLAAVEAICSHKLELNKNGREAIVHKILNEIALSPGIRGRDYICDLVMIGLDNPLAIAEHLNKKGYVAIAEKYGKSWMSVEHSIRYAKNYIWERCDARKLDDMFGYICAFDASAPTNKGFLMALIRYIKVFLEEEE